ncbi:MAG: hypothetical protein IKB38_00500 [Clostridia bacterium]|nr:hypothetical protein [Clostridia bacterium]
MDVKTFRECVGENKKRLVTVLVAAFGAAFISGVLYTAVLQLVFGSWTFSARLFYSAGSLLRTLFFFVLYAFFGLCIAFDRRKIFDFMFKNRWYIALCVFASLVILNINFSSVGAFNWNIQPDMRTDTTLPLFGIPRGIRSDEWLVYVPRAFTSDFEGFDEFNYILRATENYSISANGLQLGWSSLSAPMSWGYYILGAERGLSFYWSFLMVMSFMASYEFSLIISGGKRRLALFGAGFIGLSQFSMWWSVCSYLISAQMLIVAAYYFFGEKRIGRKILYAAVAAFSATLFIVKLYPAWQVPYGYILIGLIVWLIITKRNEIKASRWYDLLIIGAAFALMASIVLAYLSDTAKANETLLATVYPGKRFDTGGGGLEKAAAFLHTPMLPFKSVTYMSNTSVASNFFSLLPLPMIASSFILVRQIIRRRHDKTVKIDVFNVAVLIPTLFLFVYTEFGFPVWLAKYSLFSYSMAIRTADFLALANLYLLIRHISQKEERVSLTVFAPVVLICSAFWVYSTYKTVPTYMPVWFCVISLMFAIFIAYIAYCRAPERVCASAITASATLMCVLGLCVNPVMHGADVLVEKPLSYAIREIVEKDPDAKWIGYENHIVGQFLVANGAPTVNSVNYIPNLDFWHRFDPLGEKEFVYNRYAHIAVKFTDEETEISLIQEDYAKIEINYGEVVKTEAKYLASIGGEIEFDLTPSELLEKYNLEFKVLYNESNCCIYEIIYH